MAKKVLMTIVKPEKKTAQPAGGYNTIIKGIAKDVDYNPNYDYLIEVFNKKLKQA